MGKTTVVTIFFDIHRMVWGSFRVLQEQRKTYSCPMALKHQHFLQAFCKP